VLYLLENVKMEKQHVRIISERVGIYPVLINSALVSAQNRERYYWSSIRTEQSGIFGNLYTGIPQPKDRGIFIQNIIEKEVDKKYFISDKALKKLLENTFITINMKSGMQRSSNLNNTKILMNEVGVKTLKRGRGFSRGRVKELKAPTITAKNFENDSYLLFETVARRFTPTECARLQTVPEWYKWNCSNT
jgi:DNA (cytosine-5)-methyltransferase 3A